jgi:Domain of unknown function (DUF4816)
MNFDVKSILFCYFSTIVTHKTAETPWLNGVWKKKFVWKPRWVKSWKEKKVYVSVWKKVWGPVEVNEWIPLPKPPPGWH